MGRKPHQASCIHEPEHWQIRNDALHADKIMRDYDTQRRLLQTQTATWYDKENEFEGAGSKYFHRPYLERITDPNHLLQHGVYQLNEFT